MLTIVIMLYLTTGVAVMTTLCSIESDWPKTLMEWNLFTLLGLIWPVTLLLIAYQQINRTE